MKRAFHHTAAPSQVAPQNPAGAERRQALRRLHDAAGAGDLPAVKALVAAGVDPAAALKGPIDTLCSTALHAAAGRGQVDVLAWLLDSGLPADHCPDAMKTRHSALMSAALAGQAETSALLIARGASVNACDYKLETALHMASDKGHADVVRILLAAGADPSLRDRFGLRAQDVCCNNPADAMTPQAQTRRHGDILGLFHQARKDAAMAAARDPAALAQDVTVFPLRLSTPDGPRRPNDKGGKARRRAA